MKKLLLSTIMGSVLLSITACSSEQNISNEKNNEKAHDLTIEQNTPQTDTSDSNSSDFQ